MIDVVLHNQICGAYAYVKCLMMDNQGTTPSKECISEELGKCLRCYDNDEETLSELKSRYDVLLKIKRKLSELPDEIEFGTT